MQASLWISNLHWRTKHTKLVWLKETKIKLVVLMKEQLKMCKKYNRSMNSGDKTLGNMRLQIKTCLNTMLKTTKLNIKHSRLRIYLGIKTLWKRSDGVYWLVACLVSIGFTDPEIFKARSLGFVLLVAWASLTFSCHMDCKNLWLKLAQPKESI